MKKQITIDLIPITVRGANIRKSTTKRNWDIIKRKAIRDADYKCEICGTPNSKKTTECHEDYEIDDKKRTITLKGMIAMCPDCHRIKHADLAKNNGRQDLVVDKLIELTGMLEEQALSYIEKEIIRFSKRSRKTWKLDKSFIDSYLNEGKIYDLSHGSDMKREDIYKAFDDERDYQINKEGMDVCVFPQIAIDIEEHLNKLKKYLYNLDDENAKNEMRKIGTVCVKYAEKYGMPTIQDEKGDHQGYKKKYKQLYSFQQNGYD